MSSVVDAVRGVLWARKRKPEEVVEKLGSGPDALGMIRAYGEHVLPDLRGRRQG